MFIGRKVNDKMNEVGMEQKCVSIKEEGNGNWKEYMWPHQINKTAEADGYMSGVTEAMYNVNLNNGKQGINCPNGFVIGNTFNIN